MILSHTPAETFPPGEYLLDELEERGWTVTEFADMIGQPAHAVLEILNANQPITPATAQSFSNALGTDPDLWLNLQAAHHRCLADAAGDDDDHTAIEQTRLEAAGQGGVEFEAFFADLLRSHNRLGSA